MVPPSAAGKPAGAFSREIKASRGAGPSVRSLVSISYRTFVRLVNISEARRGDVRFAPKEDGGVSRLRNKFAGSEGRSGGAIVDAAAGCTEQWK